MCHGAFTHPLLCILSLNLAIVRALAVGLGHMARDVGLVSTDRHQGRGWWHALHSPLVLEAGQGIGVCASLRWTLGGCPVCWHEFVDVGDSKLFIKTEHLDGR